MATTKIDALTKTNISRTQRMATMRVDMNKYISAVEANERKMERLLNSDPNIMENPAIRPESEDIKNMLHKQKNLLKVYKEKINIKPRLIEVP